MGRGPFGKRARKIARGGCALACVLAGSVRVGAEEPPVDSAEQGGAKLEIAAKGGFASAPVTGAVTPFGAGFGGRAGLVLSNVYVGAGVVDYLGGSESGSSEHAILYGLELGYGIHVVDALLLRPLVGAGGASFVYTDPKQTTSGGAQVDVVSSASGSSRSSSNSTTVNHFYVEPAVALLYEFGASFVGAQSSLLVIPDATFSDGSRTTWLSFAMHAQIGHRF